MIQVSVVNAPTKAFATQVEMQRISEAFVKPHADAMRLLNEAFEPYAEMSKRIATAMEPLTETIDRFNERWADLALQIQEAFVEPHRETMRQIAEMAEPWLDTMRRIQLPDFALDAWDSISAFVESAPTRDRMSIAEWSLDLLADPRTHASAALFIAAVSAYLVLLQAQGMDPANSTMTILVLGIVLERIFEWWCRVVGGK